MQIRKRSTVVAAVDWKIVVSSAVVSGVVSILTSVAGIPEVAGVRNNIMEVKMIDVSVHNGVIDWDKVKASGIGGVLMRCGYGSDIESQDDKMFKRNADECSRLGIPFGVYLYSYAKNTDMAKSEADHALRLVKGYKLSYPLYIDVEEASQSGIAKDVVKVFCEAVKAAGYMPGVYANENWVE